MKRLLLIAVLGLVALTEGHSDKPVRFIHPKRYVVLGSPRGVEIPVQTLVARHQDNRAFRLEWGGDGCGGSSSVSLDGDYARSLQPIEPIRVRVGYGVCGFRASVYGPGGQLRASEEIAVRVCGDGSTECSPTIGDPNP